MDFGGNGGDLNPRDAGGCWLTDSSQKKLAGGQKVTTAITDSRGDQTERKKEEIKPSLPLMILRFTPEVQTHHDDTGF
jgi:hypothetical protein